MEILAPYPLSTMHVAELLQGGAIGILPTDTIYGVVARAEDRKAVARLYKAKHREGKPGTVVAANIAQLERLGINPDTLKQISEYWPGAISIVLPTGKEFAYLDQGKASLAVRIPKDEAFRALLERSGPLLTSSANLPGEPPATTLREAEDYFGNTVDFYVDGGDLTEREPSTVARLNPDGKLEVLRQGIVRIESKE